MTDTSTQAGNTDPNQPPPAPPAAASPSSSAPAPTLSQADADLIAQSLIKAGAVQTSATPTPAATTDNPPVPENLFAKGNLVSLSWVDDYDGPSIRYGIVLATLPDEGAGARSIVAWLDHVSGPIGDHQLAAV